METKETKSTLLGFIQNLQQQVRDVYKEVAETPENNFHFRLGRKLCEELGYTKDELDTIPKQAVDSFAGVGYHFGIAELKTGEKVLDLGSGSGMDAFIASRKVGNSGSITGIDMTPAQLNKSERLAHEANITNVKFVRSFIEELPIETESFDAVISNGVINLSAEKEKVFAEIARVLKKGGRLAISDIVTEKQLPDNVVNNPTLWASCIGGAMQKDNYKDLIEAHGMKVLKFVENPQYGFTSKAAMGATKQYGVKSISLLAVKN